MAIISPAEFLKTLPPGVSGVHKCIIFLVICSKVLIYFCVSRDICVCDSAVV